MGTDVFLALVAVLAGAFSVLTPCVLVMLPVILAVTGGEGRRRVIGVLIGLEVSFIGISLLAAAALAALGLPDRTQQYVSAGIIVTLGITLLVPALRHRLDLAMSRAVGRMPGLARGGASGGSGLRGGFVGGLGLGLVWAPCAGPFLAAITAGSVTDGFTGRTVMMAVGFGIGMLGPLLLVLKGGNSAVGRLRRRFGARQIDAGMGLAMVATAALIFFNGFTVINRTIAERVNLTSTPIASLERNALDKANEEDLARVRGDDASRGGPPSEAELQIAGYPESGAGELDELGPAPALRGIGATYNMPEGRPLDADYLEGKVVVYDFWTYSCINCIRTLPYLRSLYERYKDDGLVIVGVHAPEFAFEKDESNVRDAIDDLDVTWPVATDPELTTWEAFHNRYWPAKYITDRDGQIRYVHFGEGAYEETEDVIRELLDTGGSEAELPKEVQNETNTPETYLGYERLALEQWSSRPVGSTKPFTDEPATYELTQGAATALPPNRFGLTGRWTIGPERATASGPGSEIVFHYQARAVYLVLDAGTMPSASVVVHDSAQEGGGTRTVRVTSEKLYTLRDGKSAVDATMRLEVPRGVSAYAFTFG